MTTVAAPVAAPTTAKPKATATTQAPPVSSVAPASTTTTADPARQTFLSFWDRFRTWASTAGPSRSEIRVDMGILEVDGIYGSRSELFQDCKALSSKTVGLNGGPWAQALTSSPDPALSALYKQMVDTIRDLLLRCMNGDTWLQLTDLHTKLAVLQGQETSRLNAMRQQAERYGVSWQWPEAFPTQGV